MTKIVTVSSIDFGTVSQNVETTGTAVIASTGTEIVEVDGLTSDNDVFTPATASDHLLPVSDTFYFDSDGNLSLSNESYGSIGTTDANGDLTVSNSLPTITSVTTTPTSPTESVDFTVSCSTTLPDGLTITFQSSSDGGSSWDSLGSGTTSSGSASDATANIASAGSYKIRAIYDVIESTAIDVVVASSSAVYIVDSNNHRIAKKEIEGDYITEFGTEGSGDSQFQNPWGICSDDNYLYITDGGNSRIVKYNKSSMTYHSKIGSSGSGNDQFSQPKNIVTDGTYLFINDFGNNRIVKRLCSDLSYVGEISLGVFQCNGLTLYDGVLYATSDYYINYYNASTLAYINRMGGFGTTDAEFREPTGLDNDGTYIYCCDQYSGGYKIKIWRISDHSAQTPLTGGFGYENLKIIDDKLNITIPSSNKISVQTKAGVWSSNYEYADTGDALDYPRDITE